MSDGRVHLKQALPVIEAGGPPVPQDETIEIYAFVSAADRSKAQGGKPVLIADVLAEARAEAVKSEGNRPGVRKSIRPPGCP